MLICSEKLNKKLKEMLKQVQQDASDKLVQQKHLSKRIKQINPFII